jgi:hypothetical protein
MSQRITRTTLLVLVMLVLCLCALAQGKLGKVSDIPVSSSLADYDATNMPYSAQSDAGGAYGNSVNSVSSILVANGYNGIVDGDWRLDMSNSTLRTVGITFSSVNAVQPGDPGYTVPANPPYWGTQWLAVRMENKCTMDNHSMLTMKPGDSFPCVMIIRLPPATSSTYYRLDMAGSWTSMNEPETQDVQVSCNSANSGGCNDWFIDPVPVVNADRSTSPGRTRARLNLFNTHGNSITNKGDFYMTFHFHVTRP